MKARDLFAMAFSFGLLAQCALFGAQGDFQDNSQNMNTSMDANYGNAGDGRHHNLSELDTRHDGTYDPSLVNCNCEYQSGPCVCTCPYTRFEPQYYYTTRCVQEPYCCPKRCYRYVPKHCQKTCCRYVPQYYCQDYCYYVPQCYYTYETKCRTRKICEPHCCYRPCTYYKTTCVDNCNTCDSAPCCNQNSCCNPCCN